MDQEVVSNNPSKQQEISNSEIQELENLLQQNKNSEAKERIKELMQKHTENGKLFVMLSTCARRENKFQESYEYATKATELDPNNPDVFFI